MKLQEWALGRRLSAFALVGLSGVFINQSVLYTLHEVLLAGWSTESRRLTVSLGVAICLATISNFYWNQRWTWADRVDSRAWKPFLRRFAGYVGASLVAIAMQVILTHGLVAQGLHYLLANLLAIGSAAIANFILNHLFTFAKQRRVRTDS